MAEEAVLSGSIHWKDAEGDRILYLREGDTAEIGREPGNDVVLNSPHVSRRHAVLNWRNNQFEITDLGSVNGVKINGELIGKPTALGHGDVITLYNVDLTFREPQPDSENQLDVKRRTAGHETFIVPADVPQPRLVISAGPGEGREIELTTGKMVIGRATVKESYDIMLQDRSVSRPHAEIEHTMEGYVLTDAGSANGTLVNGDPIYEPTVLDDGDVIVIGETTLLLRLL